MMDTRQRQELLKAIAGVFSRPYVGMAPCEIVERYFRLPPGVTSRPGPVRLDHTPWLRGMIDIGMAPSTRLMVAMQAPQTAKTTLAFLLFALRSLTAPVPGMLAFSSEEKGTALVTEKMYPMIRETPELYALCARKSHDMGALNLRMAGCQTRIVGGSQLKGIRGHSVGYAMLDEADLVGEMVGGPEVVDELHYRLQTYPGGLLFLLGNPNDESVIMHPYYERGSSNRWQVRCVGCRAYFEIDVTGMIWEKKEDRIIPESIYFPCPKCQRHYRQGDLPTLNLGGKWKVPSPSNPIQGFWLPQWYSPFVPWLDICEKARACGRGKDDWKSKLKDFFNNVRAEPFYRQKYLNSDGASEISRRVDVNAGLPENIRGVYLSVDCQRGRKGDSVRADISQHYYWILSVECADTRNLTVWRHGVTDDPEELVAMCITPSDSQPRIDMAIFDEGDGVTMREVRAIVDRIGNGAWTWKGANTAIHDLQKNTRYPRGLIVKERIWAVETHRRLTEETGGTGGIVLSAAVDSDFLNQVGGVEIKRMQGYDKTVSTGADHYFDALKMAVFVSSVFPGRAPKPANAATMPANAPPSPDIPDTSHMTPLQRKRALLRLQMGQQA